MTTTIGYGRISTSHQSLHQQEDALTDSGCTKIYTDVMSGIRSDRPGLASALEYAREGDTLVVVSLDRLGRSLTQVIATIEELQQRGIVLRSLRESIDFSTATGRMMAAIFAALAEYERELMLERATAAREARSARDQPVGRPKLLTVQQVRQARSMRAANHSAGDVAKTLKVSRATLYRALAEHEANEALEAAS
jgi:DNA invertase Pin-like site-specific DNA recombinase